MKKVLGIIVGVVLIALVGAGAYLYFSFSGLVKTAVETYAPRYTQTKVTLGGVSASIFGGSATISDFVIGNPTGFKSPEAISIGKATLAVDTSTVTSPVIHITTIEIVAPHITYEPGQGSNNLSVIQKNVTKATQTSGAQAPATKDQAKDTSAQAPEKKLIIDRLTISGAQATIALPQLSGATQLVGQGSTTAVTLPTIDMRDLGAKEGGLPPAKIAEQVMSRLQEQAQQSVGSSAKGLLDKAGSAGGAAGGAVGDQLKGILGK